MSLNKSPETTHQLTEITSAVRAIIISHPQPCPLQIVLRDYKSIVGQHINYKRLGYKSIQDLLMETGQFIFIQEGGDTCISAKHNPKSDHIAHMVQRQKKAPRRTFEKARSVMTSNRSDQSWNKSSYSSNVYQNLPSPSKSNKLNGDKNNNTNHINNRNTKQPNQQSVGQTKIHSIETKKETKMINYEQQPDLRETLNAKRSNNHQQTHQPENKFPRPILGQNVQGIKAKPEQHHKQSSHQQDSQQLAHCSRIANVPVHNIPPLMLLPIPQNLPELQRQHQPPPFYPQNKLQPFPQLLPDIKPVRKVRTPLLGQKKSIQDRLKLYTNNNNNDSELEVPKSTPDALSRAGADIDYSPSDISVNESKSVAEENNSEAAVLPPKVFQFNPELDPVTSLTQYCLIRKSTAPEFNFVRPKVSQSIQCRVKVRNSMYSTYPDGYPDERTAKIACAKIAIEAIKIEESRRRFPVCSDSDKDLQLKIFEELQNHPHGIFVKNFPEWFETHFEQRLPDHWWSLIDSSKKFHTELSLGNVIIFANDNSANTTNSTSENESFVISTLSLPWQSKHWNLYITNCVSTVEIWARLFGEAYSEEFDNLMNDIDIQMLTEKTRPISVACNQYYLVCLSECWHRVRLDEVDKVKGTGLCFFIDFGDEDWLPINQLYICEKKFLKLAPQAVPFSLFGLEDFAGNPNAKTHLINMLANKSMVAEILTKEAVYNACQAGNNSFKIQAVLYDTSSHEDINLNPLLLNQISNDTPLPEIKTKGLTNVIITHVNDEGDVFMQVRNSGLLYVQKLIQQLIESKFKEDQYKVTLADIQSSKLYLICDKETKQWYRGVIASPFSLPHDVEFDIYCIDHGIMKRTHISNIFRLESLSAALSKFPRQAIRTKLDNIIEMNAVVVARLRGLLPPFSNALVKLAKSTLIPLVIVYKRLEGSQAMCNVNEVIRIEQELESSGAAVLEEDLSTTSSSPHTPSPEIRNNSLADINHTFSNKTINSVPNSPTKSEFMLQLQAYENVPNEGEYFEVWVTLSANPCNFMVQPYKDSSELRKLMKDLQEYCKNNNEYIPVDMVEKGQAYAGQNKDGLYQRVIVENVYGEMIHVSYCDYGGVDTLQNDQLRTLPGRFRQLPKQAIQAKLYGIAAKNVDWSLEDCIRFQQLTVGQKFVSVIKKKSNGDILSPNTPILELDLIDVQTDEDIYIRDTLLEEQRAIEI